MLVPVVDYENEPKILLTRRADHLKQHSGQVAFPGGKVEAEDVARFRAALREAQEEIGLAAEYVDIAGFLSHETGSVRILPVVGFVRPGFQLEIDHNEVAETFEVPLELAINEANYSRHEIEWEGRMEAYYAVDEGYNYGARPPWHVAQSQQEDGHDARDFVEPVFVSPAFRADRAVGHVGAPHQPARSGFAKLVASHACWRNFGHLKPSGLAVFDRRRARKNLYSARAERRSGCAWSL